jgi:hypothetical protein
MAGVRTHFHLRPGGVISALVMAFVCPLAVAQTPPGTEITNVATSNFLASPPSGPPGGSLPADPVLEVISNEVRTRVTALAALETLVLAVEPAGTVAPGTLLDYTLTPTNGSDVPLTGIQISLPLDPGLGPPVSWTDGSAPLLGGGTIPVTASYDPVAGLITWNIPVLDAGQGVLLTDFCSTWSFATRGTNPTWHRSSWWTSCLRA